MLKNKIDKKSLIIGVLSGTLILSILGGSNIKNTIYDIKDAIGNNIGIFSTVRASYANMSIGEKKDFKKLNPDYESPVVKVAKEVGPSVVGITVRTKVAVTQDPFDSFLDPFGDDDSGNQKQEQVQEGSGSGIIFNEDGFILTNNHVITEDSDKVADEIEVTLQDKDRSKKKFKAKVIGRDPQTDLAVIKIDGAKDLTVAEFGNSDSVKVGDLAIAIGNPMGEEFAGTVTSGYISALNRKIQMDDREFNLIQTDAAINAGNSGGALVNVHGEVIGVNSVKLQAEGVEGMGFAIPINQVKLIIKDLVGKGKVVRPQLGVYIDSSTELDDKTLEKFGIPKGILVSGVVKGSGAEKAGIKKKDIITKVDGHKITSFSELRKELANKKVGDTINIELYRKGKAYKIKVKLSENRE